jgi:hypothetical protein
MLAMVSATSALAPLGRAHREQRPVVGEHEILIAHFADDVPGGMEDAMRMHSHLAVAIAAVLGTLVPGCGPRYQTFASYTPQHDAGRQCLAQCLSNRQICRQTAQVQTQQCRVGAQTEAQLENFRRLAEYQAELERYESRRSGDAPERPQTLSPTYGRCDGEATAAARQCGVDHDLCYQNCGGQVTYTTHCVANCDG